MAQLHKKTLLLFVLVTLAGAVLHFVYALLPNPITALISPINESLWEHVKILFWPGLVTALLLSRGEEQESRTARLLVLLGACVAMLAVGWLYHVTLGGDSTAVDVGLYVVLMACVFFLPTLVQKLIPSKLRDLVFLLTIVLGMALVLFTFLPPDLMLFMDLSGANTFAQLPC